MARAVPIIGGMRATPALDRAHTEAPLRTGGLAARARADGGLDPRDDQLARVRSVGASASPQISWTFFFKTSNAAVSASAR